MMYNLFKSSRQKCFCAFCKNSRTIYTKKRISFFNIFMSALAAVSTMLLVWQSFDPRVVLFFIAYMVLTEILVQLRWRLSVICPHCGFDPVLYLKDSNKAAQKVKNHLEKRKSDPATLFKPPVKLPSVKAKADHSIKNFEASQPETSQRLKSGKSKSSIISKQI